MTAEDDKDFENSIKCWICDKVYVDEDVKVRGHCHTTGKYKGSVHRDCNVSVKVNHKMSIVFRNIKNYDSHLILQEPGKFNFEINAIPNKSQKYIYSNINNKLVFIDSFQFLSSSLNGSVEILGKNDYKYLSQDFDNKILDLVRKKGSYPYEYISDFEKFKEEFPRKEKFCNLLTGKTKSDKEYEHFLKV